MNDATPDRIERDVLTYEAGGGTEHFISYEDPDKDLLVGFCRLRFSNDSTRKELQNAALVRELHVYGNEVGIGRDDSEEYQHQGYGRKLLEHAERMARNEGYDKLSVISGIGVRQYYREKLDYYQDGPYISTRL